MKISSNADFQHTLDCCFYGPEKKDVNLVIQGVSQKKTTFKKTYIFHAQKQAWSYVPIIVDMSCQKSDKVKRFLISRGWLKKTSEK